MEESNIVYFLIVNYQGAQDTIELLRSINSLKFTNVSLRVIIIDNHSKADDVEHIREFIEEQYWVTLLELDSNIGYFPAFNVALEKIKNNLPAPVVLCNNDLIMSENFINDYFQADYFKDVLVVAPNIITSNGVHQNPHRISRISKVRKFLYEIYFSSYLAAKVFKMLSCLLGNLRSQVKEIHSHKSQYIHMGIGACYILRPVFFQYIEKLDGRIFLGGEEALLAGQLERVSGRIYYDSALIVHHAEGISFAKMPDRWRYEESRKAFRIYKNYL